MDRVRLPAAEVCPAADEILAALLQGCPHFGPNVRGVIAGSLRRGETRIGDVEIVLEPRYDADLFGNALPTSAPLDAALKRCLDSGLLAWDKHTPRNGPRYKRFVIPALGLPLDLFLAGEGNWGNILAIRTGDADFSRLLVTRRAKGGLLPNWMRCGEGRLYGRAKGFPDYEEAPDINEFAENVLPCPTEEAFFHYLWLPVPAMHRRTAASVPSLRGDAYRRQREAMDKAQMVNSQSQKEAFHA